jgi:hypothetical protein
MKIKGDPKAIPVPSKGKGWVRRMSRRSKLTILAVLLVLVAGGSYVGNKLVKTKGYNSLWDFISTVTSNFSKGLSAEPEKISITIKQEDYDKLARKREEALQRGLIVNEEGSYVPAEIAFREKKIKVKMRLKGHMTDHIQGEKWSFRVRVKGNDDLMGMRLFSMQHPGTRGYIYEWIYHQMMKREDIIALRYEFVTVELNGKSLGIYAIEENFDEELVENNKRKKGPVMRFDPDLYWINRFHHHTGEGVNAEYSEFQSARLEPYREEKVTGDSLQEAFFTRALALMEGFRRGKLQTDEVFDVPRTARFHAIIDLVGGHHSLDWSDIKYYYNPVTDRLEPVAYESFTVLPSTQLSGMYRFADLSNTAFRGDYHRMLFSNEKFFREYIKSLERISQPAYLDELFKDIAPELEKNLAILYKEFPYKKFEKQQYYRNQEALQKMMNAPKHFHAYYQGASDSMVHIRLGTIESMPVEIKGLSAGKGPVAAVTPVVLPGRQFNGYVEYKDIYFKLLPGVKMSDSLANDVSVDYSVLGSSRLRQDKIFPYPYGIEDSVIAHPVHRGSTVESFPFLRQNDSAKIVYVMPGQWKIASELVIPAGYKLVARKGVKIDMLKGGSIISHSPLHIEGTEDEPVVIASTDSSGGGIAVIGAGSRSVLRYVSFSGLNAIVKSNWKTTGALSFYESPVTIENCSFTSGKAEDAVNIMRSDFIVRNMLFNGMKDDALDIDFSEGSVTGCVFESCTENGIDITMSRVKLDNLTLLKIGGKAINVKNSSSVEASDIRVSFAHAAVSVEDLSDMTVRQLSITDCEFGLAAFKNKSRSGPASLTVTGLKLDKVKMPYLVEKNSSIIVEGAEVKDKTGSVDKLLKKDVP